MSVARISGPELLDAPLRTIQMPANQQGEGVGADLRRDPGGQSPTRVVANVSPRPKILLCSP